MPGIAVGTGYGLPPEGVEVLAFAGGSRIERGAYIFVVAAVVFDVEVHVQGREEKGFGHPLFVWRIAVAQFVADIDTDSSGHDTDVEGETGHFCPAEGGVEEGVGIIEKQGIEDG